MGFHIVLGLAKMYPLLRLLINLLAYRIIFSKSYIVYFA